jgi:GABA(A) receptor-associated protein
MTINFRKKFSLEKRIEEAKRILEKYPNRIPIIVEKDPRCKLPEIQKYKYLVPDDLSMAQFMYVIRKRIKLKAEESIYTFINNKIIAGNTMLSSVYEKNKSEDGFLYVIYTAESTFG